MDPEASFCIAFSILASLLLFASNREVNFWSIVCTVCIAWCVSLPDLTDAWARVKGSEWVVAASQLADRVVDAKDVYAYAEKATSLFSFVKSR